MNTPRIVAVIVLLFLMSSLTLACIGMLGLMSLLMPVHAADIGRAGRVELVGHVQGKVVWMAETGAGMDFVLETARGQSLRFQCDSDCRASPWHLERHMQEQAETDVFYVEVSQNPQHNPRQSLQAIAVD